MPFPLCECTEGRPYIEHLRQQRLMMFLIGLNESYSHVRSDILLKAELPSVNQAYAIVVQEESQRVLGVVDTNKEPLTMMAGRGQGFKGRKSVPGKTTCEIYGYKNHVTKNVTV